MILLSVCVIGIFAGLQTQSEISLLDPKSNPLTILHERFVASGWSPEQASYFSHRALGIEWDLHAPSTTPPTNITSSLLDPKSNPLTILYEEFLESGWSTEDAAKHAHQAMGLAMGMQTCDVYPVRIAYCSGDPPTRYTISGYLNALCWEGTGGPGLDECAVACPAEQSPWLKLTVEGTGCPILPADGTCIAMRVSGTVTSVNCNSVDLQCSCFEHTNPVDCDEIDSVCCVGTNPCTGCPCDDY
jgi:hypothetical protein